MDTLLPLLPPLIVFILGAFTHRVILSLLAGVLTAVFIATGGSPVDSFYLLCEALWNNCETFKWTSWESFLRTNKLFVVGFILSSGILFHLMQRSNGVDALVHYSSKRIKNARTAETTSLLLSHSLFIDGCLSSITVSSIIRPIADRFNIPRLKTALLADSMSGPLVVICPFSCFTALLIALMHNNGIEPTVSKETLLHANPNLIYWMSLPFSLYSISIVATFWMVVRSRLSIGTMNQHEQMMLQTSSKKNIEPHKGTLWNFLIPTLLLPISIVMYIILFDKDSGSFWQMLTTTPISFVLFAASMTTLFISCLYFYFFANFTLKEMTQVSISSIRGSLSSVLIIVLAWTLADLLRAHLQFGQEISMLISGTVPLFLMPLAFFWLSSTVSSFLGTSWGTVAIFIPLVAPILIHLQGLETPAGLEDVPLLLPSLGAVVSGAAFGDHVSLLSDSTVLSCVGAKCHPVEHVKTQFPYALPVFLSSSAGFLLSGFFASGSFGLATFLPLIISVTLSMLLVLALAVRTSRRARNY